MCGQSNMQSGWPRGLRRQTQGLYLPLHTRKQRTERSGPRMWARVRIPLLTIVFPHYVVKLRPRYNPICIFYTCPYHIVCMVHECGRGFESHLLTIVFPHYVVKLRPRYNLYNPCIFFLPISYSMHFTNAAWVRIPPLTVLLFNTFTT